MNKPKIGDKVYMVSNAGAPERGYPCHGTVEKVGRLYFTVKPDGDYFEKVFTIKDGYEKSNYSTYCKAYESEEAYLEYKIRVKWSNEFQNKFNGYGFNDYSLEQYEAAGAIFGISIN